MPKTYLYTPELYRKRYKFRVLPKLDQAEELEHITDWSVILHNFDVLDRKQKRKEKREKSQRDKCERRKIEFEESDRRTTKVCLEDKLVLAIRLELERESLDHPASHRAKAHSPEVETRNAKDTRNAPRPPFARRHLEISLD